MFKVLANRLIDAFFLFKKRKGEIVAGAATFFAILSFCPVILLMISLTGFFMEGPEMAKSYVLGAIEMNVPQLAPWILQSLERIIDAQLKTSAGFTVLNTLILFYACLGVVGSMIFGLNTITKHESKGGFFFEDGKSIIFGALVAVFMGALLFISNKKMVMGLVGDSGPLLTSIMNVLTSYNVLPALLSLSFFTFFYQIAVPRPVAMKDAFLGASAFVGCFMAGKSFYWIYLLYSKDSLTQSYGNFYTLFIAVFWVYFLMCSFFYGASVVSVGGGQKAFEEGGASLSGQREQDKQSA